MNSVPTSEAEVIPAYWRQEPALKAVSLEARGLWCELIVMMEAGSMRNYSPDQLAKMLSTTPQRVGACIGELVDAGIAKFDNGVLVCPWIDRERARRKAEAERVATYRKRKQEPGLFGVDAPKPARPAPIELVQTPPGWKGITTTDREAWTKAFPYVDIDAQLAVAAAWCIRTGNRKKRYDRFILNWLKNAEQTPRPPEQIKGNQPDKWASIRENGGVQ